MLVRKYKSAKDVPDTLDGFFDGFVVKDLLDKNPHGNTPGRIELLYSYPMGGLVIPNEGLVSGYNFKLTSAEFDAREGVRIRAVYLITKNCDTE